MNLVSVNKFMTTIDSKFLYASYARSIGEGGGIQLALFKGFYDWLYLLFLESQDSKLHEARRQDLSHFDHREVWKRLYN